MCLESQHPGTSRGMKVRLQSEAEAAFLAEPPGLGASPGQLICRPHNACPSGEQAPQPHLPAQAQVHHIQSQIRQTLTS